MSRSAIQCKSCGETVAYRHHNGHIRTVPPAVTVLKPSQTVVECKCGHRQIVEVRPKSAA